MRGLDDPTVMEAFGERVLLTHGDALCLSDVAYQKFRLMVRNPPGSSRPCRCRRRNASASARRCARRAKPARTAARSPADWADVDFPAAMQWMEAARAPTMIHGHTHRPGTQTMAPGYVRHVLSDWDLDHAPYRAEVLRWSAAGLHRVAPATRP